MYKKKTMICLFVISMMLILNCMAVPSDQQRKELYIRNHPLERLNQFRRLLYDARVKSYYFN